MGPADKFLIALWRLSTKDAEAFVPVPSDGSDAVAVVLSYCYADVPLPARYDVVFRCDSPAVCESIDLTVVRAFGDGRYPFDRLEHGWKHIGALQFKGAVPPLIQQLPIAPSSADMPAVTRWIGICRSEDFPAIRNRRWSWQVG